MKWLSSEWEIISRYQKPLLRKPKIKSHLESATSHVTKSGNVGGLPGSEELPAGPQRSSRPREVRQHVSGGLYKPSGGPEVSPSMQTGASDPPVVPGETVVSESNIHPGKSKSGSRRPVETGAEARGLETRRNSRAASPD